MPADEGVAFGRALLTNTPLESVRLEAQSGRADRFQLADDVLNVLLGQVFSGDLAAVINGRGRDGTLELQLPQQDRSPIEAWYDVSRQERNGAWYLPTQVSLKVGIVNLPAYFHRQPRFATGLALDQRLRVSLAESPEGVFFWAVLQPLFEQLMRPLLLRGPEVGQKTRDEQVASWSKIGSLYEALGLDLERETVVMRYGSGWSHRTTGEQLSLKQDLIKAMGAQLGHSTAQSWRILCIRTLADRYYAKAGRHPPTQRQVLTGAVQPVIAGWFQGDWLAFLRYIDERPAPNEQITTALPEPRLYRGSGVRGPANLGVVSWSEVPGVPGRPPTRRAVALLAGLR